ncbi:hypothetical protein HAX54_049811, partial [Datura stramonium]|nr:hypothetical protein [Datura stramonium]
DLTAGHWNKLGMPCRELVQHYGRVVLGGRRLTPGNAPNYCCVGPAVALEIVPCCLDGSVGKQAPRASSRAGAAVRRIASRAGMAVHSFLAIFLLRLVHLLHMCSKSVKYT